MEERHVTVDGVTYHLESPFIVIATQNPIEMEGTYPLPEAQRDRFMARVSMGYPSAAAELAMLTSHGSSSPLEPCSRWPPRPTSVTSWSRPAACGSATRCASTSSTSPTPRATAPTCASGASPRATLHLLRAARAHAALAGRDHVLPDDVQQLAVQVLAHRLLLTPDALLSRRTAQDVVTGLLQRLPVPAGPNG